MVRYVLNKIGFIDFDVILVIIETPHSGCRNFIHSPPKVRAC